MTCSHNPDARSRQAAEQPHTRGNAYFINTWTMSSSPTSALDALKREARLLELKVEARLAQFLSGTSSGALSAPALGARTQALPGGSSTDVEAGAGAGASPAVSPAAAAAAEEAAEAAAGREIEALLAQLSETTARMAREVSDRPSRADTAMVKVCRLLLWRRCTRHRASVPSITFTPYTT